MASEATPEPSCCASTPKKRRSCSRTCPNPLYRPCFADSARAVKLETCPATSPDHLLIAGLPWNDSDTTQQVGSGANVGARRRRSRDARALVGDDDPEGAAFVASDASDAAALALITSDPAWSRRRRIAKKCRSSSPTPICKGEGGSRVGGGGAQFPGRRRHRRGDGTDEPARRVRRRARIAPTRVRDALRLPELIDVVRDVRRGGARDASYEVNETQTARRSLAAFAASTSASSVTVAPTVVSPPTPPRAPRHGGDGGGDVGALPTSDGVRRAKGGVRRVPREVEGRRERVVHVPVARGGGGARCGRREDAAGERPAIGGVGRVRREGA